MDSLYLQKNVGGPLAKGLGSVMIEKPEDPVDFLGKYLLAYVDNEQRKQFDAIKASRSAQQDQLVEQQIRDEESARISAEKAAQDDEAFKNSLCSNIGEAQDFVSSLNAFIASSQERFGTTGSYIVEYNKEEDSINYVAANDDHEFLLDQQLERGSGVILDLWPKRDEDDEEPEPEEEEEEEPEDDEEEDVEARNARIAAKKAAKEAKLREIKVLAVPNTLNGELADRIHFHKLPNVGGFLAVSIQYPSVLNEESLTSGVEIRQTPPEEPEEAEEKEEEEEEEAEEENEDKDEEDNSEKKAEEDDATAGEEGGAAVAEEGTEHPINEQTLSPEEIEEQKKASEYAEIYDKVSKKQVHYAVCLDTLGQVKTFSPKQIEEAKEFARALATKMEAIDRSHFRGEIERRIALQACTAPELDEEQIEKNKENAKDSLPEDATEEDIAYALATKNVEAVGDALSALGGFVVLRGPALVLQAALALLNDDIESYSDGRGKASWKKISPSINSSFIQAVQEFKPREVVNAELIEKVVEIVGELTAEEIKESNYPLSVLLEYVQATIAVKNAEKEKREREEAERIEAERIAAEEAAAAEAERIAAEEAAAEEAAAAAAEEANEEAEEEDEE